MSVNRIQEVMCDYCTPAFIQSHPVQVNYNIPLNHFSVSLFLLPGFLPDVADYISDGKLCQWFSAGQRMDAGCKNQPVWNLPDSSWVWEPHIHFGLSLFKINNNNEHTAAAIADSKLQPMLWTVSWQPSGLEVSQCLGELAVNLPLLFLWESWSSAGSSHTT